MRWAYQGGCPKDRLATSVDGEPGHNYLCADYQQFFEHATPMVAAIMDGLRLGRTAKQSLELLG